MKIETVSEDEAVKIQKFINKKHNACMVCGGPHRRFDKWWKKTIYSKL